MSGHNKWSKIKHKKAAEDSGKSKLFSKLAAEISIAARDGQDPQFNAALRGAIDRAKKQNVPLANIDRAIKKASDSGANEDLLVEAYGPDGVGVIVEATTDNKNRTMGEIRLVLKEHECKVAEQGSLMWSFEKKGGKYVPRFATTVSSETKNKIAALREELDGVDGVMSICTSVDAELA